MCCSCGDNIGSPASLYCVYSGDIWVVVGTARGGGYYPLGRGMVSGFSHFIWAAMVGKIMLVVVRYQMVWCLHWGHLGRDSSGGVIWVVVVVVAGGGYVGGWWRAVGSGRGRGKVG